MTKMVGLTGGGVNCWASENLSGRVHFEGYSPEWRVLSKLSVQPCMLALSGPEFCSCSCIFTSRVLQLILSLIFQLAKAKERVSDLTVEAENTAVSYS